MKRPLDPTPACPRPRQGMPGSVPGERALTESSGGQDREATDHYMAQGMGRRLRAGFSLLGGSQT